MKTKSNKLVGAKVLIDWPVRWKFTFNGTTWEKDFSNDDQALEYAEGVTDTAASAVVERLNPATGKWIVFDITTGE